MAPFYRKSDIPERLQRFFCPAEIGLEPTPDAYVQNLVAVFREVRRVLRDDGTLWLNLGDSYAANPGQRKETDKAGPKQLTKRGSTGSPSRDIDGLAAKNLVGIPWRVAFALQADGWYLRSDIIWSKPNPMPESVTDRPTKAHEYLFLLTKAARYYYDADAIAEASTGQSGAAATFARATKDHVIPAQSVAQHRLNRQPTTDRGVRNKRSVWTVPTQPYPEAHFATFPEKLVEPCILAGCPAGGVVLDPFCGSGRAGIVATRLDRHFLGIDLKAEYCAMARGAIRAAAPQAQEV